jgi:hypothetical protein
MQGGVGTGGEIPPVTRLGFFKIHAVANIT